MTTYNGGRFPDSLVGGTGDDVMNGRGSNDTLLGYGGADSVHGGFGNDMLYAYSTYGYNDSARDYLYGEGGNDLLSVSTDDIAYGGTGNDTVLATGDNPFILNGGTGTDTLRISADISGSRVGGFERLEGSSSFYSSGIAVSQFGLFSVVGAQDGRTTVYFDLTEGGSSTVTFDHALTTAYIRGGDASETLALAAGTTTMLDYDGGLGDGAITGGDGNDTLTGGYGADILRGGAGNDEVYSTYSNASYDDDPDWLFGAGGDDTLRAGTNDTAFGGSGNDSLIADEAQAELHGDAGNDWLQASNGADILDGGAGNDTVSFQDAYQDLAVDLRLSGFQSTGGSDSDSLSGFENAVGGSGDDTLTGTSDANVLEGGTGDDSLDGAGGRDTASYASEDDDVTVDLRIVGGQDTGGAGIDTLVGMVNLIGGEGNDTLTGAQGSNIIEGGAGSDVINGRIGSDLADYSHATARVQVSLALTGPQNTLGAGTDSLISMEDLRGSLFADGLAGNAAANRLYGLDDNDILVGGANNDTLTGGLGADRMRGGTGFDTFDFNLTSESTRAAPDLILDFIGAGASWGDVIDLSTIDANTTVAGNQAFTFGSRGAGGLSLIDLGPDTLVRGNTDADAAFEFAVLLRDGGRHASVYSDFDFIL